MPKFQHEGIQFSLLNVTLQTIIGLYISRDKRSLIFLLMKTKSLPLALLIVAGLLSSTATANAYTTYGNTVVNGTTYNLSPSEELDHANLSNANLTNANLWGANLWGANLYNANLSNANLAFANLYSADLSYANLTNAALSYAYLSNADLTGATVSYSNWADFSTNSGASGLGSYSYDTSLINYAGPAPAVPEPSTYGFIGIAALGVAFAARRRKLKTV